MKLRPRDFGDDIQPVTHPTLGQENPQQFQARGNLGFTIEDDSDLIENWFQATLASHRDEPALITGRSGTGKSALAETTHSYRTNNIRTANPRIETAFLGGSPDELLRDMLFGHESGSYTGAKGKRQGAFENAGNGTIFLDEIGDIPPGVQFALLRVLETHTFRRIGGNEDLGTQAHIIAATNKDLQTMMMEKLFREDLYYRFDRFIHIKDWIERDLQHRRRVVRNLLRNIAGENCLREISIDDDLIDSLAERPFINGDIRTLRRALRQCVSNILGFNGKEVQTITIGPEHMNLALRHADSPAKLSEPPMSSAPQFPLNLGEVLSRNERDLIIAALEHAQGNRQRAARLLNIDPKTLYSKLITHHLRRCDTEEGEG